MGSQTSGWCLDAYAPAPELRECTVSRGGAPGVYFETRKDQQGNSLVVASFDHGVNFFTDRLEALRALSMRLQNAIRGRQLELNYLEREKANVDRLIGMVGDQSHV